MNRNDLLRARIEAAALDATKLATRLANMARAEYEATPEAEDAVRQIETCLDLRWSLSRLERAKAAPVDADQPLEAA